VGSRTLASNEGPVGSRTLASNEGPVGSRTLASNEGPDLPQHSSVHPIDPSDCIVLTLAYFLLCAHAGL
jgi:hypothetical protein